LILNMEIHNKIKTSLENLLNNKGYNFSVSESYVNPKEEHKAIDFLIYENNFEKFVIRIDNKASLTSRRFISYIYNKNEEFFKKGLKRVLWILTRRKEIIIADESSAWINKKWNDNIEIGNIILNLEELLKGG